MTGSQSTVHGSIFFLLKKFVIQTYSESIWEELLQSTGKESSFEFIITEAYPLNDINLIVNEASQLSGISVHALQEAFGEWLVPDLFKVYSSYLNPFWKTRDVLINTEKVFHGAVRNLNSTAEPPVLHVAEVNENFIMIDYFSKRKMGSLAVGIIKGIAKYFNEDEKIDITPTTEPDAERVQIKVTFR